MFLQDGAAPNSLRVTLAGAGAGPGVWGSGHKVWARPPWGPSSVGPVPPRQLKNPHLKSWQRALCVSFPEICIIARESLFFLLKIAVIDLIF